jgi:branched-chain amino acid transport system permease protein
MERFLQYLFAGLSAGSAYSLVALGLVLVYQASRVLNFAHGDVAALATFVAYTLLATQLPFWAALGLAVLAGGAVAVAFYGGVLVPAQRREGTLLGQVILTLGLGLTIQGAVAWTWGTEPQPFAFPLSDTRVFRLGPVSMSELALGKLAVGVLCAGLLYGLVQRTRLGLAMRAIAENLPAAQTLGIPTRRIAALNWAMAAALGAIAGILLAPTLFLDPYFMLDPFLKGFAAAILGGLTSLPGAIAGGLALGVAESLSGAYLAIQFKNTLAFLIILVVLLIRPEGLFGREFHERV